VAKTYDAILKQLVDAYAADWLTFLRPRLGLPPDAGFEPIDADLSTVSVQPDKLFRLTAPATGIVHLELQAGPDAELPDRLLLYNVLAHHRHGGPVHSAVLLLRRQANLTAVTGTLQRQFADGRVYHEFTYGVIRLWELPADELLHGPLGTLPLAALTDDAVPALPSVVGQIDDRLRHEADPQAGTGTLRTALYVLLGLRYDQGVIERLFQGVQEMEESVTYQAIIEKGRLLGEAKGRIQEARRIVRLQGQRRFGTPDSAVEAALNAITDLERLERLAEKLPTATDWTDLLATP
jgi:predicted transposase YdaD